ncbi:unnamed protein product [Kuraishia capsulata CBS 1993]|uniref:Hydantoinase/oxoprolinase N-terminal domain-containing protein n=1 Tax=Kuraishia capsulata CBS 1993 TaxID=1382522 RepID=W6MUR6_9ASCO|nr:uncharacterized protein KUCA_T00001831001 [Kuraishia capsulata CBS 1993]CDK25860.1 unnamed protein product [Kuraishia capsulata CBS 1993]
MQRELLIGVDVGGTNTDAVLLDAAEFTNPETRGVLAWNKSNTTTDVSDGIEKAIQTLFDQAKSVQKSEVAAVTIGTTHFINAVIEQDRARLEKVAVLRLCGPYTKNSFPFSDFPAGLRDITEGYVGYLQGGNQVTGDEIRELDEAEIREHCSKIKKLGLSAVVVIGIFATMLPAHEIRCAEIVAEEITGAKVVMSHQVSGVGFLERENAAILNASIVHFANKIIASFKSAIKRIGLDCPLLLTQNDGTVLTTAEARQTPIRTFSSGATNSMRGASFLCSADADLSGKAIMVVDVGGTTTDAGLLLPNGFPRQSSSYSIVGGVRMNFSMPQVESIGLGGGSIVRIEGNDLTVGPDSVGSEIMTKSMIFGGNIKTASDLTIAQAVDAGSEDEIYKIGNTEAVKGKFDTITKSRFTAELKTMLEGLIDRMRTSPEPLPVLLVGGGSFIVPSELEGASKVLRPPFFGVANAIGAAIGKISASTHTIRIVPVGGDKEAVLEGLKMQAFENLLERGALRDSITTVDLAIDTVPYIPNTYEFQVKMVGDVDYKKMKQAFEKEADDIEVATEDGHVVKNSSFKDEKTTKIARKTNWKTYRPFINADREWLLSEPDLELIAIGSYILGCGGGGNPYAMFLQTRNFLRQGDTIKVVDIDDIHKYCEGEGAIISVGFAGSPTVSKEKIPSDELMDCYNALAQYTGKRPELVLPLEIGGSNGFTGFQVGTSSKLNIPVVDGDFMGRAYPTHWQTIPFVYSDKPFYCPAVFSDGNGNDVIIPRVSKDVYFEKIMRASLAELSASVGCINAPMKAAEMDLKTIHRSVSLAWRIGKAVMLARQESDIEGLPNRILEATGGPESGKHLFSGKIVGVETKMWKGHAYGEVRIEETGTERMMTIPFKNENIICSIKASPDSEPEVICSVPDLISVIDADTGEAVGTSDYRYGIMVFVLGIAPSDKWTSTQKGIDVGGPKSFDMPEVEYKPLAKYFRTASVIDEYYEKP